MAPTTMVKSFAELGDLLETDEEDMTLTPELDGPASLDDVPIEIPDLDALVTELETAAATLAVIERQEEATRAHVLHDMQQYDAVVAKECQAEEAYKHARELRQRSEDLAAHSLTHEDRAAATRVAEVAARVEGGAEQFANESRLERERLTADPRLTQVLEERARRQAEEETRAAEAERAQRLASALTQAHAALESGHVEEASWLLGPLVKDYPNNPDVASLTEMIARYARNVKASEAEEALWQARRTLRREPADAAQRLAALDVGGLPETLSRQVFGEWARACARLCRSRGFTAPLRYAPNPGRGAVLVRENPSQDYIVVSSLGMGPIWQPGSVVSDVEVRHAHPLR